ncbi:hypothetical protein KL929_003119 [Ogataea haglerorum]|uniref:Beta-mannosyltransferase 1 n=1 Tax=Ogataea haglerorum TaxID=1937702 RepID=A0ABQ7RFG8_9ASCO|nr:hypothetical protein KL914_003549 [Ogataea haglerorum]KAG7737423.1 hypothetical protein KL923_003812 [Ogataea haglerorum]KAG7764519.1 hypothetical protein KL946_003199 [Ogataea haglerorum]KAG7796612.1 hypothetical protein KL929_003119 [Ogataea haglerorum]
MAFPFLRSRSRYRLYILLAVFVFLTYYYWPVNQIEQLSDSVHRSTVQSSGGDASKDPGQLAEEEDTRIYRISTEPLRVNFNPDTNELEVPKIIEIDSVNEALSSLNLKPLRENSDPQKPSQSLDKVNLLSEFITSRDYKPLQSVKGFIGNIDVPSTSNYYDLSCSDIIYKPKENRNIEYSEPILLTDDLASARESLLSTEYKNLITMGDKVGSRVAENWRQFSGASVWLPDEECHLMASRIIYAPNTKSNPVASFIRLQLFDANWREITGRRIRYSDITKQEIDNVLRDYNEAQDDSLLDKISIKFPTVLDIPFDPKVNAKELLGPEDPRILFKDGEYVQEPVIFFNMLDNGKRTMHAVFPLRKPNPKTQKRDLVNFKISGIAASRTLSTEKNWAPFFDSIRIGDSSRTKGYVQFLYTVDPLVVFRCSLDNGKCEKLQDNIYYSSFAGNALGFIRGGTELVPVPRQILQKQSTGSTESRLQMWVGFVKTHIDNCGCGDTTYRPSLMVLTKDDGVFRVDLMTDSIDFDIDVLAWDERDSRCGSGPNVLTPNGISFWNIKHPEDGSGDSDGVPQGLYKDYMGLTISESDANIKIVFLRNVLNYILGIHGIGKHNLGEYELNEGVSERTKKVSDCMLEASYSYCKAYARKKSAGKDMGSNI